MDGQITDHGRSEENTSANASLQNTEQPKVENVSQQNFHQQQQLPQLGINIQEGPLTHALANNESANDMHTQIPSNIQQNLSSIQQESIHQNHQIQQEHEHHQTQQQPQQEQKPQMPPHHPPIKPLLVNESSITIPPNALPNQAQAPKHESPQKAIVTKVKLSDELNIFDWFRTKEIISQIAEKAKSSVDSVITTLDPGMKEYLYSGGNVNIIVISDSECLVSPIRDAFQSVFGRATVAAASSNPSGTVAAYPIRTAHGLQEAVTVAQQRVKKLRQDTNSIPQNQVIVAIQPTLVSMNVTNKEIGKESDGSNDDAPNEVTTLKWFSTYCILVEDPVLNVTLNCYSQFIPIDTDVVDSAKGVQLPTNFIDKHLGFAGTIDELMAYKLRLNPSDGFRDEFGCYWLRDWAGLYETQIVHQMSLTLAHSYRRKWNDCARLDAVS